MKSVIIRQNGKIVLHLKRTKDGVYLTKEISMRDIHVRVILKDNQRIDL